MIVFSLGTMVQYEGFSESYASAMLDAMAKHKECQFLVRINEKIVEMIEQSGRKHLVIDIKKKAETAKNHPNIVLVKDSQRIPQQQIMGNNGCKFISRISALFWVPFLVEKI